MEKIKKIIQIGSHDGSVWHTDGQVAVMFEDPSVAPIVLDARDGYKAYEEYARQNGISGNLTEVIETMSDDVLEIVNSRDKNELYAFIAQLRAAQQKAMELSKEHEAGGYSGDGKDDNSEKPKEDSDDVEKATDESVKKVKKKSTLFTRLATGTLAAAAAIGAGAVAMKMIKERNVDNDSTLDNNTDKDMTEFERLLSQMEDDDPRKVVCQTAIDLVTTFNEQTHKNGNFRLEADGSTYLDLSDGEALVLATFANYNDSVDLYRVFGDFDITADEAQDLFESARTKVITYYMNAREPSGLAEIFKNEEDKAFFSKIEQDILNFNAQHTTEASDQVLRDVYYNYVLNGAANSATVNPMAKVLAFDAVGGMNLVESASKEHTKFLKFYGNGSDAETRYYIENVLHKDYNSMSSDEIDTYRVNIIEKGTKLLDSSSSSVDKDANMTELVNLMGLCEVNNEQIIRSIQSLDTMVAISDGTIRDQFIVVNNAMATSLRSAGYDDLATKVAGSINSELSEELLQEIRARSSKANDIAADYEIKADQITGRNRPSMVQILDAAQVILQELPNYNPDNTNIATLVNNRRHVEAQKAKTTSSSQKDDSGRQQEGLLGYDDKDIPIYDSSVLDGKTKDEVDQFIIDNGEVIEETETETIEEVAEEDLTPEEHKEVEKQKAIIEASVATDNAYAAGQKAANDSFNSYGHGISGIVYDRADATGSTWYDLSRMTLADAVSHAVAYGDGVPSNLDAQCQNAAIVAAENYANSFSAFDQEALANGIGSNWRQVIKDAFVNGYMTQIQSEVSTAISVGMDMKRVSEEAQLQNQNADTFGTNGFGTFGNTGGFGGSTGDNYGNGYGYDPNLGEQFGNGEQSSGDNGITSDDFITGNGQEDENGNYYDPNIGEQFGDGEQPYQGSSDGLIDPTSYVADESAVPVASENEQEVGTGVTADDFIAGNGQEDENGNYYDPNLGEQFGNGEQLISDMSGTNFVVGPEMGLAQPIDEGITPLPAPVVPVYETEGTAEDDYNAAINDALTAIGGELVDSSDNGMGAKIR